jgi:DNA-binding response OmpR family regulator
MATTSVLLVDDDRDVADTLAYIIKRSGYRVAVAYDGEMAIRLASQQLFDFVFMDFMLPGKNGAESLKSIIAMQPQINAYMMTSYGTKRCSAEAFEAGAKEFLHKPVMPEDILGKLSSESVANVLVVDDDPIFTEIVSSTLETAGWQVLTAENGLRAIDILSRGGIGAVVLDINMPELDGQEVCRELKRRGIDVPILVVTGTDQGIDEFSEFRVKAVLQKPIDPREVLLFVEEQLSRSVKQEAA